MKLCNLLAIFIIEISNASRPCEEYKANLDKILNSHFYQKHQLKNQANSLLAEPKCDSNGFFQPVQCTDNHCCCVERNTGKPILSTTTSITNKDNLYCENSFPKNCILYVNKCSKCQRRGNTYECTETDCYNPSPPLCLQYQSPVVQSQISNEVNYEKPGSCPPVNKLNIFGWYNRFSCTKKCNIDIDCGGEMKCCTNGCSTECKQPLTEYKRKEIATQNCCSAKPGYRISCFANTYAACSAKNCCWDSAKRECYKQKSECGSHLSQMHILAPKKSNHFAAKWYLWSGWGECDCDRQLQLAFRACQDGKPGQGRCIGQSTRQKPCNQLSYQSDCSSSWLEWSSWSVASATCGKSLAVRSRDCDSSNSPNVSCKGDSSESKVVTAEFECPSWSNWSNWKPCSATCSVGTTSRDRYCIKESNNPGECEGNNLEVKDCESGLCPVWKSWSDWSECSATCGPGFSSRLRECSDNNQICDGDSKETKICLLNACPTWSAWSDWSECSVSCGNGTITKTRTCDGIGPCPGGGSSTETAPCDMGTCPYWTEWTSWSDCSVTAYCTDGFSQRNRICELEHHGPCPGPDERNQVQRCSTRCGELTKWSEWTHCTALCDGGRQKRNRYCVENNLIVSQDLCLGEALDDERDCGTEECSNWSEWSNWALHPRDWKFVRHRKCFNRGQLGKETCSGSGSEEKFCNKTECPYYGPWSTWERNDTEMIRFRECINGEIGQPGCNSPSIETQPCSGRCERYGDWTDWKSTDGEVYSRTMNCLDGAFTMQKLNPCKLDMHITSEVDCSKEECAKWAEWNQWTDQSPTRQVRHRTCSGSSIGTPTCSPIENSKSERLTTPWTKWILNPTDGAIERMRSICDDRICAFPERKRQIQNCDSTDVCPYWSGWTDWIPEDSGFRRSRKCIRHNDLDYVHLDCPGKTDEFIDCDIESCGEWSPWSEWKFSREESNKEEVVYYDDETEEHITSQTENLVKYYERFRTCTNGKIGLPNCFGPDREEGSCFKSCPYWSNWSTWTTDGVSTDDGMKRTRKCLNSDTFTCEGDDTEYIQCDESSSVCPIWSEWAEWTDVKCSSLVVQHTECSRERNRRCIDRLDNNFDDLNCFGEANEVQVCKEPNECPSISDWSLHLDTFNRLVKSRSCNETRFCYKPENEIICDYENNIDCPYWSEWTDWMEIVLDGYFLAELDVNDRKNEKKRDYRSRKCINEQILVDFPESKQYKGHFCPGDEREERDFICSRESCDRFSPWVEKSRNSTHLTLERECYGNSELEDAQNGSNICLGETLKVQPIKVELENQIDNTNCEGINCPFWSQWSEWSDFGSLEALHQRGHVTNEELVEGSAIDEDLLDFLVFTENEAVTILDDFSDQSGQSMTKQYRKRECINLFTSSNLKTVRDNKNNYCPGEDLELRTNPLAFDDWAEWSPTGIDPASRQQRRQRACLTRVCDETDMTDERDCDLIDCDIFTDWVETSRNTTHVNYARSCEGVKCKGETERTEILSGRHQRKLTSSIDCMATCPRFSTWSEFKPSENNSEMIRKRYCLNNYECEMVDTEMCEDQKCVFWSTWSEWIKNFDGTRIDKRTRKCRNGNSGDNGCKGNQSEKRINTDPFWSEWSKTSDCSVTCGEGLIAYSRFCTKPNECTDGDPLKLVKCEADFPCPQWVAWESWGDCSTTCGAGERTRLRECPSGGCAGNALQSEECNIDTKCPAWSEWSQPTKCSKDCGGGIKLRTRHCLHASNYQCSLIFDDAKFIAEDVCNTQECPVWSTWSLYSECSKSCGNGIKQRSRNCLYGDPSDCPGEAVQNSVCNNKECPRLSDWSYWSACSVSCGSGTKTRTRKCVHGTECDGELIENVECILNNGVCPTLGEWSEWWKCSERCDGGTRSRERPCENGIPGEKGCIASFDETEFCNESPCPFYTPWQRSECSASCGGGFEAQSRSCKNLAEGLEDFCTEETVRLVSCNEQECPSWSQWSQYGGCSATCGTGKKLRTRECENGFPGQRGCDVGTIEEYAPCNTGLCPAWTNWSVWSECSATCSPQQNDPSAVIEMPTKSRRRDCLFGNIGDIGCEGDATEFDVCNTVICPHWTEWKETMPCTATCGGGLSFRTRLCINGTPNVTPECAGEEFENPECNTQECPFWSAWLDQSECTATCGGGKVQRSRLCINGIANESPECQGDVNDQADCNSEPCAFWNDWSEWSECTAQCDSGTKTRFRECTHGSVGDDGCEGDAVEVVQCQDAKCKTWTEWESWSPCSVSCARGSKTRDRKCVGEIGECKGSDNEATDCFAGDCPTWSVWKDATECPVTCGGGLMKIVRECFNGIIGMEGCQGEYEKVVACNEEECPKWNLWSEWTVCTSTCGGGTRTARRKCVGGNRGQDGCRGDELRFEACNMDPCIYWTEWNNWTTCQSVCEDRNCINEEMCALAAKRQRHYRYRNCINGQIGENGCEGGREESKSCSDLPICDQWAQWNQWSDCSKTCKPFDGENGERVRLRGCNSLTREDPRDRLCPGEATETQPCGSFPCTSKYEFDAIDETICEPKYEDSWQTDCKGFKRQQRKCTDREISEGECPENGFLIENIECDLNCPDRKVRNRPSEFTIEKNPWFSDEIKNKIRNNEQQPETGGPRIKLKSSSVCAKADIVLLFDSSSSMDGKMDLSVQFALKLVKKFKIGLHRFRFGIAKFDKEPELLMSLRDSTSNLDVTRRLAAIDYENGFGTMTGKALEFVSSSVLNKMGYQGDRVYVPDIIVLVTDGKSADNPENISMRLHDRHVKIITVGIGPKAYEPQLHRIATPPVEKNSFKFDTYKGMVKDEAVRKITARIREECYLAKGWSKWGEWENCSTSCGPGKMQRRRRCHGAEEGDVGCEGSWKEIESCNILSTQRCKNESSIVESADQSNGSNSTGKWVLGEWTEWSDSNEVKLKMGVSSKSVCSVECGGGVKRIPNPLRRNGKGSFTPCNTFECPKIWTEWSTWSDCSVSCGSGSHFRLRKCEKNSNATIDLKSYECQGDIEEIKVCEMGGCPFYLRWSEWSPCSATCGESTRARVRECKNSFNGECFGPPSETDKCEDIKPCPYWAEWADWSTIKCSAACGQGSRTRERECINGEPRKDCTGNVREIIDCNLGPCQEWTEWGVAGSCSVTCGIGTKVRSRDCKEGICPDGEACCIGDRDKVQPCRGPMCPATPFPKFNDINITTTPASPATSTPPISAEINPFELIFNSTDCPILDDKIELQCYGNECSAGCQQGYSLVGNDVISCNSTTQYWNVTAPECAPMCTNEVDIILIIPSVATRSQSVYLRTFIKKIGELYGMMGSDVKFSMIFEKEGQAYWIMEFEQYNTFEEFILFIDRINTSFPFDSADMIPADLLQFLFNMSGRTSPNVLVHFDVANEKTFSGLPDLILNQDQPYRLINFDLNTFIEVAQNGHDHDIVHQLADEMQFCDLSLRGSLDCLDQSKIDLSFVIDSSSSIGGDNFEIVKQFAVKIIQEFNVGPDRTQISLLRYNSDVEPVFWMDTFNTKDEIVAATKQINYSGSGTNTGEALEFAATNLLNPAFGARADATQITIVITDGKSDDNIVQSSKILQSRSNVIAIGITRESNMDELARIASVPLSRSIYQVSAFNDLTTLVDSILDALCTMKYIQDSKELN